MENKDTETDYEELVRVGDQKVRHGNPPTSQKVAHKPSEKWLDTSPLPHPPPPPPPTNHPRGM